MLSNKQNFMIELTSNPKNIVRVQPFVEQVTKDCNISQDVFGNILISVTEAVNNAILHGNQGNEQKKVHVSGVLRNRNLIFKISDEGTGFDPKDIPDPTAPDNLMKLGGRGVFLMRQLADRIKFLNNGTTVEMMFRI